MPFLGLSLAFFTRMANSVMVQFLTGFPAVINKLIIIVIILAFLF